MNIVKIAPYGVPIVHKRESLILNGVSPILVALLYKGDLTSNERNDIFPHIVNRLTYKCRNLVDKEFDMPVIFVDKEIALEHCVSYEPLSIDESCYVDKLMGLYTKSQEDAINEITQLKKSIHSRFDRIFELQVINDLEKLDMTDIDFSKYIEGVH